MVRGYQSCQRFCEACKQDCKCSKCDTCHSCRISITKIVCNVVKHDCLEAVPQVQKSCWEAFVKLRGTSPGTTVNFKKFVQSRIIKVCVGKDKDSYYVHEHLLRTESRYFEKMLLAGMRETKTGAVTMECETDTPLAFEKFIQWCYFGYYVYGDEKDFGLVSIDAAVYVFADRVQCTSLQTFALEQARSNCASKSKVHIQRNLSELPQTVAFVYGHTMGEESANEGDSRKAKSPKEVSCAPKDGFRKLLAAFSAVNLDSLRKESSFMDIYRSSPDFASDVLHFVKQGSDIPGFDSSGSKSGCIIT